MRWLCIFLFIFILEAQDIKKENTFMKLPEKKTVSVYKHRKIRISMYKKESIQKDTLLSPQIYPSKKEKVFHMFKNQPKK